MTRYIDADALKKSLDEHVYLVHHGFNETEYGCTQYGIHQIIDDAPTIDAVPVKRGKWIIRDNPGTGWYRVTCSECCEDVTATAPCIGFYHNARVTWNYCPECGADMRGEK